MRQTFIHTTLLFASLFILTPVQSQDDENTDTTSYFVPTLISENVPWEDILDAVKRKYPDKSLEISHISATCNILKDPDAVKKYPAFVLAALQYEFDAPEYSLARDSFLNGGEKNIPILLELLRVDAATRIYHSTRNGDIVTSYSTVSDLAMSLLEVTTQILFYQSFPYEIKCYSDLFRIRYPVYNWPHRHFSREYPTEKERVIGIIEKWYTSTRTMTKEDAIIYFIDSLPETGGSRFHTAKYLVYNHKNEAIRIFTKLYKENSEPCNPFTFAAVELLGLGVDIASTDCMNALVNYSCGSDRQCICYLLNTPTPAYSFAIFAEVVATERFSIYRRNSVQQQMTWIQIFDEAAYAQSIYAEVLWIELLKIKMPIQEIQLYTSNWRQKYPNDYAKGYRVCDFALLKLSELKKVEGVDWSTVESRDRAITKLLEN